MATETLLPSGDDVSNWSSTGANEYDQINDESDSTYVYTNGDYVTSRIHVDDTDASSGQTINSVTVWARGYTDGNLTTGESKVGFYIAPDPYYVDYLYGGAWENLSEQWDLNPADDEAWASADIDGARGCYASGNLDNEYIYMAKNWWVVDYQAAGGVKSLIHILYQSKLLCVIPVAGFLARCAENKRIIRRQFLNLLGWIRGFK